MHPFTIHQIYPIYLKHTMDPTLSIHHSVQPINLIIPITKLIPSLLRQSANVPNSRNSCKFPISPPEKLWILKCFQEIGWASLNFTKVPHFTNDLKRIYKLEEQITELLFFSFASKKPLVGVDMSTAICLNYWNVIIRLLV